ncbi:MAG: hypothetical protein NTV88_01110 [Candidatus Micrarchaeota archaeon]|nr:hypothetical protein [Candidatus Micrarchaeota archaeon]
MPVPKNRSTSVRKIHVRVPKRGHVLHFKRRLKGKTQSCALCGSQLPGVARRKTPNRKYGGNLCTACSSRVLTTRSRLSAGSITLSDVDVKIQKYVK